MRAAGAASGRGAELTATISSPSWPILPDRLPVHFLGLHHRGPTLPGGYSGPLRTRASIITHLMKSLVDLFAVVRGGLIGSEPNYSIKSMEAFYDRKRDGEVRTAGGSVVANERWRVCNKYWTASKCSLAGEKCVRKRCVAQIALPSSKKNRSERAKKSSCSTQSSGPLLRPRNGLSTQGIQSRP